MIPKLPTVGMTPLVRIEAISSAFSHGRLLVKDESANPFSGTIKDRKGAEAIRRAQDSVTSNLVLITNGNFGYSLAKMAGPSRKVYCVVDNALKGGIKGKLREAGAELIETDLSENHLKASDLVQKARSFAAGKAVRKHQNFKAVPVSDGLHDCYWAIIREIKAAKVNPAYIVAPIGSGELVIGLHRAMSEFKMEGKLVGVAPKDKGSKVADKLACPFSPYPDYLELLVSRKQLLLFEATDEQITETYAAVSGSIRAEPSAATAFCAIPLLKAKHDETIVVVNTGFGLL